jgi:hypothetical protein
MTHTVSVDMPRVSLLAAVASCACACRLCPSASRATTHSDARECSLLCFIIIQVNDDDICASVHLFVHVGVAPRGGGGGRCRGGRLESPHRTAERSRLHPLAQLHLPPPHAHARADPSIYHTPAESSLHAHAHARSEIFAMSHHSWDMPASSEAEDSAWSVRMLHYAEVRYSICRC